MPDLYLATGNAHKVDEMRQLSAWHQCRWNVRGAGDLGGMPEVEENADTFAGNAALKAQALRACAPDNSWVLADDSGLAVDALDGAPGVYSARYAGPGASDADNFALLLENLRPFSDPEHRRAHFICVLHLIAPDGTAQACEGRCSGHILFEPRGEHGFGYDPVFQPDSYNHSFAELGPEVKDRLSHRAHAFARLCKQVRE